MTRSRAYYQEISEAYKFFTTFLFKEIRMDHLIEIATQIVSRIPDITPLTRDEKRKKMSLLQWFDQNWEEIQDLVSLIVPTDESGNITNQFDPNNFHFKFRDEDWTSDDNYPEFPEFDFEFGF